MKAQAGNMNTDKNNDNDKITGWLLDVYPMQDKMVLWIKQNNNNSLKIGRQLDSFYIRCSR
jgi:hypothetical protein